MKNARKITDTDEIELWIGRMFRPSPQVHFSARSQYSQILGLMGHASWVLIEGVGLDPSWADLYQDKYGEWKHQGGKTSKHNHLGMAWGWWALEYAKITELCLGDSPDIYATIDGHNLVGDIGQATYVAWKDGITGRFGFHDIWVSVLDYDTQIIVEAQANIGMMISTFLRTKHTGFLGGELGDVYSLFECPEHGSHYDMRKIREYYENKYPHLVQQEAPHVTPS